MVKDSVIKGMGSAVEQEAEEKIGEKQLEIAGLKETIRAYRTVEEGGKLSHIPLSLLKEGNTQQDSFLVISNPRKDHDGNLDFLRSFISEVKEQLGQLKKEVNNVKGGNHCRRINSGDELVGLGSNLPEEVSERLIGVDSTFSGLQSTLDSFFSQLKDMVDIREMQQEWELTAEIEATVVAEYVRSLHGEFERKLWDLSSCSRGCENFSSLKKTKEITALREELVVLSNLLFGNDNGQLGSQVSLEDAEACSINKKSENLNRKPSGNLLSSASPWEGSGKHDELIIAMPENLDPAQLKDMPRDELISYFKSEMTNMKRNYESVVQEITEEVFSLKREYFKERGSPSTVRKDKEFEGLKRKIPEVVLMLDGILMESNSVVQSNGDAGSLGTMRDRLEDLLAENHRQRGILSDKEKEVKCPLSQISEDAKQISSHSSAEEKLLEMIRNINCKQEDAQVEASISEEVYKCFIKEMMAHMHHISGKLYNQKSIGEDFLAKNHRLRDILSDKKKEVKCLLSQISEDAKQISSHSSAEAKLLEMIRNIASKQEDAQVEASISEEVYKCIIKKMMAHLHHISGNLYNQKSIREDLLAENHQLRDILSDKKKEVKCLLSQISEDAKQISSHSSTEAKLLEMIRNIASKQEDAQVEASISEEVYKCIIKEMMAHMHHISGKLYNQKSIGEDFLAENHRLRDILSDKKKEVKRLLSQISEDAKQISSHSSAEAKLLEMIRNIASKQEDAQVEASISEEVYKCIKEMMAPMHHISGKLYIQKSIREDLLAENNRLKGILSDEKKEVKCLPSQISEDAKQISSHSSAEAKPLEMIRNIASKQEDAQVEASISEEVYKCIIKEMMAHMHHISGNLYNQKSNREDVHEIACVADCSCQSEFENLNIDSVILQGFDGMIFAEFLKDAKEKLSHLNDLYVNEMKHGVSLELEATERERSLVSKILENEKLKQETTRSAVLVGEKVKLAQGTACELSIQMKQCEKISQELDLVRAKSSRQQILIAEMNEKSELMKGNLAQRLEQIETYEMQLKNLDEKLNLAVKELSKANEERGLLLAATQEKENGILSLRVKERENLEQLESMTGTIHELLKKVADLEQSISEDIQMKNMRLGTLGSQLSSLKQEAVALRRMGSIYEQRLERRCSDLQKAEAEVDLLGDQVDTLSNLLEKVYIGLDHYSPILQHYPGIMEVLKLLRRELTGESS